MMKNLPKPDLDQAKRFLTAFKYNTYTFQTLKNQKPALTFATTEPDLNHLDKLNRQGHEIFFMVNEGDGVAHPPNKTPRAQASVCRLTSLFLDLDGTPIKRVRAFLKAHGLKPHFVVETSPSKYHLYFLLDPSPHLRAHHQRYPKALSTWKRIQNLLVHLGEEHPVTDSSVKDLSRILRVPGFYHLKNPAEPHLVQIRQQYTHPPYSLDETLKSLSRQTGEPQGPAGSPPDHQASRYRLPSGKVARGNRHAELTSLLAHVLNRGLDPELALRTAYGVIQERFQNPEIFLPGGERHHELTSFIDYKLKQLEQEESEELTRQRDLAIQKMSDDDRDLELPEKFFLTAPGITGEITRAIDRYAHYPLPSFAFVAALSLLSTLKGKSCIAEDGTPPTNYFLSLAPTGAGKSYAKDVIKHTLHSLHKSHLLESKARSDRGILNWLNRNDSVGTFFMDEGEEFLRSFEDRNCPSHIRNLKTLLLELYSATSDPHLSFGEIASRKEDPVVLKHPRFSVNIMGTPNIITSAFTAKSITDGLFQRFNIIYSKQPRIPNPRAQIASALNGHIYKELIDLSRKLGLQGESGGVTIRYAKGAKALKKHAIEHYTGLYNKELERGHGLEGIYTRAAEKALRLAVTMTEGDVVEASTLEYSLAFVEKNTAAMKQLAFETFAKSELSKDMDDIQKFVAKNCNQKGVCSYRRILRGAKIRDSRRLKNIIDDCVDIGMLVPVKLSSGGKGGRPGWGYAVGKVL